MRILVTGAAGLVGSGVADRLARDHEVVGLDLNAGQHVDIVADCDAVWDWGRAVGKIDGVVHCAALHAPHVGQRSDDEFRRVNLEATRRLLDFAIEQGATRFVFTSTTSLYGHALEPTDRAVWVDETLEPEPRDIYDETKLGAEALILAAGGALTPTVLRMSRCFPEPASAMAWYRLYRGVDRRDVADAHALALERQGAAATYVISAETPFRRADCSALLRKAPAVFAERCPVFIDQARRMGWVPPLSIDRVYDCGLAMRELGFRPRFGVEACIRGDWDPYPSD